MSRVIFISGLGADSTAFNKLGEVGLEKIFVEWIPITHDETLQAYAALLVDLYQIKNSDIMVGLSFGGLVAQEIAIILGIQEVILISSFRNKYDLRFHFKLGLSFKLYHLMPPLRIPLIDQFVAAQLNSGTKESRQVLNQMLESTDYKLMKWSLKMIDKYNGDYSDRLDLYNIIGTKDRIVTQWKNQLTFPIAGGSHFMVYDKAVEITNRLSYIIKNRIAES